LININKYFYFISGRRVLTVFFFCVFHIVSAQKEKYLTHISLNGFYSYYKVNTKHLTAHKPSLAFSVAAKEEWRFSTIMSVTGGLEFFSHGVGSQSYYFTPGETNLYNKEFDHTYKLRVYELNVPFLLRGNFTELHRERPTAYFELGPAIRWMLNSNLKVRDAAGNIVSDGKTKTEFEFPLLTRSMNMFLQFSTGYHFYNQDKLTGFFIELNMRFAPIRFLVSESFTANSLYFHNFHAGLGVGVRL
jgi:hypothetical protein